MTESGEGNDLRHRRYTWKFSAIRDKVFPRTETDEPQRLCHYLWGFRRRVDGYASGAVLWEQIVRVV